jgi:aspartate aminotransferase
MSAFPRTDALAATMAPLFRFLPGYERRVGQPGVVDLTFGNPHEAPLPGLARALALWAAPQHGQWFAYPHSLPAAQATVAASLRAWRGLPFEAADIAMTNAGFGALAAGLKAVTQPGDEVIFSLPPWFGYEQLCLDNGLVSVKVRHDQATWDLDLDAIAAAITPRTRVVLVNTPNNPTGRIYPPATLTRLAAILAEASARNGRPIYILSDEPYSRLVFDGKPFHSPSAFYPNTLIAYSYGKVLCAPGQRLGWLALTPGMPDREAVRQAVFLAQFACAYAFPNALLQRAIGDLDPLSIDIAHLQRKRDRMLAALRGLDYAVHTPEGTFYLFPRSPIPDDVAFTEILAERGVLAIPGAAFEQPGYFRLCLTATDAMLDQSLPAFADAIAHARTPAGLRK